MPVFIRIISSGMQAIDIVNNNQTIILCRKFLNITRIFYNLYKIIMQVPFPLILYFHFLQYLYRYNHF